MIIACSFIVLAVIFTVFILLLTSGLIVFSKCVPTQKSLPEVVRPLIPKPVAAGSWMQSESKAYIDLNGRLIELHSKAEEKAAKKEHYKIIYK